MKKILGIFALLVAVVVVTAVKSPSFKDQANIENVLMRTSRYAVFGIGVAFVIITGGIDLSIGSTAAFVGCLLAYLISPVSNDFRIHHLRSRLAAAAQNDDAKRKLADSIGTLIGNDDMAFATEVLSAGEPWSMARYSKWLWAPWTPLEWMNEKQFAINSAFDEAIQKRWKGREGVELFIAELRQHMGGSYPLGAYSPPTQRWSTGGALVIVACASLLIGLYHGLLVTKLRLQPFVVTLCSLMIFRGITRGFTNDATMGFGTDHEPLRQLALAKYFWFNVPGLQFQFPAPFLFLVLLALAAGGFLNLTVWGRYLLALGRNEQAARFSGIHTDRMVILAYVLCAICTFLGGVILALELNSMQPSSHGNFLELNAIAAAVLGGCSLRGGEGSILGVVIGAALLQMILNAINLLGIASKHEFTVMGAVILVGVVADELFKRLSARRLQAAKAN